MQRKSALELFPSPEPQLLGLSRRQCQKIAAGANLQASEPKRTRGTGIARVYHRRRGRMLLISAEARQGREPKQSCRLQSMTCILKWNGFDRDSFCRAWDVKRACGCA